MKSFLTTLLAALAFPLFAQETQEEKPLTIAAFADVFYQFDFNRPSGNQTPGFLYNHNRHNEFNVNLAYLKAAYDSDRFRGNLALMAGTYAQDNLGNEPAALRTLYEANVGVRLAPKWWIDMGILPSHIGFESAKSSDCATLTRSLLAENSPYFETGAKLSFTPNERLTLAVLWLNGWQRMARVEGNSAPQIGAQLNWKPNDRIQLNYSGFIGSDRVQSDELTRYFNNFYGIFSLGSAWQLTLGFDFGIETNTLGRNGESLWYSPIAIARWQCSENNALALRLENYNDEDGVILGGGQNFSGMSLNYDRKIGDKALWRIEGRLLQSEKAVFLDHQGNRERVRPYLTTSLAISL